MPQRKGSTKTPGSGRKKGKPNKRTQEIAARLAAVKCDPIMGMAAIALDKENSPELRGRMFSELAQYIAPKRKAVEISGAKDGVPVTFIMTLSGSE